MPARNWEEVDLLGIVSNFLQVAGNFLFNFPESGFIVRWLSVVHFVTGYNHLLDSKGVRQKSMFTCLTILGNTSFKFTSSRCNNKYSTVSLKDENKFAWAKVMLLCQFFDNFCPWHQHISLCLSSLHIPDKRNLWIFYLLTCDVPVIMFLIKSRWPGASMTVT